jgi:riboflavin biosynthesis pyrimidine reductase
MGGPATACQAIRAGLIDEIAIHVVPVLLGAGARLFADLGPEAIELNLLDVVSSSRVTHLRYRVIKPE